MKILFLSEFHRKECLDARGGVGSREATARVAVIVISTLLHEEDCCLLLARVSPGSAACKLSLYLSAKQASYPAR